MSVEENIKLVRRAIDAFNTGDTSRVHEFICDDYIDRDSIGKDGKMVEHKAVRNDLKFMMQLEVVKPASEFEPYIKGWKGTG